MAYDLTFLDFSNPLPNRNHVGATIHLGALYIISVLEQKGYHVDYRDYQTSSHSESLEISNLLEFAKSSQPIVFISCMAYMLPLVILFSEKFKKENNNTIIVLGGPGPAGVGNELLENFSFINYVLKGEGENSTPLLLDYLSEKDICISNISGLVYRDGFSIKSNDIQRISNLDELPLPAYHAINPKDYSSFGIITGRGCVYKCKFCDVHGLWGDIYKSRSLDNVFEEIHLLVDKYSIKQLNIWDDTFISNRKRVISFCQRIINENINIQWNCFGRINLIDEELLQIMKKSGCTDMFFGIESGSKSVLSIVEKQINLNEIIDTINITLKYMNVSAHLIWGFPFENSTDIFKTIYLYNYLKDKIQIGLGQLWPYPTTPLYKENKHLIKVNYDENELYKILPTFSKIESEKKQLYSLIEKYPHIFTQYTIFEDPNFYKKRAITNNLRLLCNKEE